MHTTTNTHDEVSLKALRIQLAIERVQLHSGRKVKKIDDEFFSAIYSLARQSGALESDDPKARVARNMLNEMGEKYLPRGEMPRGELAGLLNLLSELS